MLVTKLFSVHRASSLHWGQILFRAHNGSLLISQSNVASSKNKHISALSWRDYRDKALAHHIWRGKIILIKLVFHWAKWHVLICRQSRLHRALLVWEYHKNSNKKEELPLSLTKPFKLPICKALDVTSVFFINNTTLYNNRKMNFHYSQSAGGLCMWHFATLYCKHFLLGIG